MKAVLVAALAAGGAAAEMVKTPHGLRPAKCVHRVNESAHISQTAEGHVAVHLRESNRHYVVPRDEECVADALRLAGGSAGAGSSGAAAATGGLKTWEDYVGWRSNTSMYNFTATYTNPQEEMPASGELLYYFIGFQNNPTGGDDNQVTIVQPVMNYDMSGRYGKGWGMEPWNCCPGGQSFEGKFTKMSAGEQALTWVYTSEGRVDIGMSKMDGSGRTDLTVDVNHRVWNWATASLEVYMAGCTLLNSKPYNFGKMVINDEAGRVTPDWKVTGDKMCKGGAIVHSPDSVSIYGRDMP